MVRAAGAETPQVILGRVLAGTTSRRADRGTGHPGRDQAGTKWYKSVIVPACITLQAWLIPGCSHGGAA